MNLFLTKLLPIFVYPLGGGILLGILALGLSATRFRAKIRLPLFFSILVLWVGAMPALSNWLYLRLEAHFPPVAIADLPHVDVIVLLGGIVGQPLPPRIVPDLGDASDRILEAVRIYRAGNAPTILVTGGNLPWQTAASPEAELIKGLLIEFGVPSDAVITETNSRNTRENAINSGQIFRDRGWQTGLLVTSAVHMPRAYAAFRKFGIDVTPAPTDFKGTLPIYDSALDFLPDADALAKTTLGLKEVLGFWVYRVRGWD